MMGWFYYRHFVGVGYVSACLLTLCRYQHQLKSRRCAVVKFRFVTYCANWLSFHLSILMEICVSLAQPASFQQHNIASSP